MMKVMVVLLILVLPCSCGLTKVILQPFSSSTTSAETEGGTDIDVIVSAVPTTNPNSPENISPDEESEERSLLGVGNSA